MPTKRYSVDQTTCGEYPYCGASVEENPEGEYFRVEDVATTAEELHDLASEMRNNREPGWANELDGLANRLENKS